MVALMPNPMRLVPADDAGAERRMFERKQIHARAEGQRCDHTNAARREPAASVALRDRSLGGLRAISGIPLERGERVNVFFPPHGIRRGWDARGRVVRCEPSALGYRVALEFDPLPA